MNDNIYNQACVDLHRVLGRRFNNPLGEDILKLISYLIEGRKNSKILDVGCGRGLSTVWLASHTRAKVVGVDPSEAMITEARRNIKKSGLADSIRLVHGTIDELPSKEVYDIVFALDVLSWIRRKNEFLILLRSHLKSKRLFVLTDYFSLNRNSIRVKRLCKLWGIGLPPSLDQYRRKLKKAGFNPILVLETTKQYYDHWFSMYLKLKRCFSRSVKLVGSDQVLLMKKQIQSILAAVEKREFGHLLILAEKA